MNKTLEEIACEVYYEIDDYGINERCGSNIWSKVISAIRPQIEAEARAVAIEEAKNACIDVPCPGGETYTYWPCVNAITALSTLLPGFVCVPVDLLEELRSKEGACLGKLNEAMGILLAAKVKP